MVKDSEKFAAEDEQARKKVEAKNSVENYAYTVRTSINDDKVISYIPLVFKLVLLHLVKECLLTVYALYD